MCSELIWTRNQQNLHTDAALWNKQASRSLNQVNSIANITVEGVGNVLLLQKNFRVFEFI
jgi:hypothetical protein